MDALGKKGTYEPPSNVTRIARVLRRTCSDGTPQIINYFAGVGTGTSALDHITGGAFGMGLDQVNLFPFPIPPISLSIF